MQSFATGVLISKVESGFLSQASLDIVEKNIWMKSHIGLTLVPPKTRSNIHWSILERILYENLLQNKIRYYFRNGLKKELILDPLFALALAHSDCSKTNGV